MLFSCNTFQLDIKSATRFGRMLIIDNRVADIYIKLKSKYNFLCFGPFGLRGIYCSDVFIVNFEANFVMVLLSVVDLISHIILMIFLSTSWELFLARTVIDSQNFLPPKLRRFFHYE